MTMTDAQLTHRRRLLIIGSLPVALAALLLALKLVSLSLTAAPALENYERAQYGASAAGFDSLFSVNLFQPWLASFNRGTALAASGDLNGGIDDLEHAFADAPADRRCDVAVNLALSWELLGDTYYQQGQWAGAERLYETSRAVIDAAREDCPAAQPGDRDAGQELSDSGDRLSGKADAAGDADAELNTEAPASDPQEQLDRLQQQNQDAAGQKAELDDQDRADENPTEYTERPW